jgi:mRNA interferase HicA
MSDAMKCVDLIRSIEAGGCVLVRHGGRHDWYRNPATGVSQPGPRHREIKESESLARRIIRLLTESPKERPADDA